MSAPQLGDYLEDDTLHFLWSSNNSLGASVTRATNGQVRVYKDNGLTQSVAGITDTEDFDALTGVHAVTIDLSADAFYAVAGNYTVALQGATIDGQTVNAVLAHFSIENRYSDVTTIAIAASAVNAAAIATDAIDDDAIATGAIASTAFAAGAIDAAAIATDAIGAAEFATDAVNEIRDAIYDDTRSGIIHAGTAPNITASAFSLASNSFADDEINDTIVVIRSATLGAGQVRTITDFVAATESASIEPNWTTTPTGTVVYMVVAAPPLTTTQETRLSELDDTAGKLVAVADNIETDTTAIEADTQDIQGRLPADLTGGRMRSNVEAMGLNTITSGAIATGAIDADAIATDAITAAKIAANAIGASELATDAIGDAQIATGAIASTAFAAGAIDAAAIAANAIGSSELATGAITAATFGAGALDAAALATDAGQEIADRVLARNIAGGSDTGRVFTDALRALRNRVQISSVSFIVYEENDTTIAWHGSKTTTADHDFLTEVNPS